MDHPAELLKLPFTADDLAVAQRWHREFRSIVVRLRVFGDHDTYPEVLAVGEPWPSVRFQEARWLIWRTPLGVGIADTDWVNGEQPPCQADNLDDALRAIWKAIEAERQEVITAMPEVLGLPRGEWVPRSE